MLRARGHHVVFASSSSLAPVVEAEGFTGEQLLLVPPHFTRDTGLDDAVLDAQQGAPAPAPRASRQPHARQLGGGGADARTPRRMS